SRRYDRHRRLHPERRARGAATKPRGGSAMSELDLRLKEELDVLFPVPRVAAGWEDVLARAQPRLRRRRFVLAVAAAVVVLGSAAAVTAALGGFDAWLSGKPGKPASREEQARF